MPVYTAELSDGRLVDIESESPPSEQDILKGVASYQSTQPLPKEPGEGTALQFNPLPVPPLDVSVAPDAPARSSEELAAMNWAGRQKLYGPAAFSGPEVSHDVTRGLVPDRLQIPKAGGFVAGAATEAGNVGLGLADFATSPLGLASVLGGELGPTAARAITAGFSLDMIGGALKAIPEAYENWSQMTPAEQGAALVQIATGLLGGGFLAKKAVTGWGAQPEGAASKTRQQAVAAVTELAQKDPAKFAGLLDQVTKKKAPIQQREPGPTIPAAVVPGQEPERQIAPEAPVAPAPARQAVAAAGQAPAAAAAEMQARVEQAQQAGLAAPAQASAAASARAQGAVEAGAAKVAAAPLTPEIEAALRAELEAEQAILEAAPVLPKSAQEAIKTGAQQKESNVVQLLRQEGLSDADISDLITGEASVPQVVARKLQPFEGGGGPDHAKALEEARQAAVARIEQIVQPTKGAPDATQEGKVEKSFQPERVGTAPLGVSDEASPRDSLQPAAPGEAKAEVVLKPTTKTVVGKGEVEKEFEIPDDIGKPIIQKGQRFVVGESLLEFTGKVDKNGRHEFYQLDKRGKPKQKYGRALTQDYPRHMVEQLATDQKYQAPSPKSTVTGGQLRTPPAVETVNIPNAPLSSPTATPTPPAEVPPSPQAAPGAPAGVRAPVPPQAPGAAPAAGLRPGPGAATGGWAQTAIKTLNDQIAALPKSDARSKVSFAERWAEKEAAGRDIADKMVLKAAGIGASIRETMRGVTAPTELGAKVGELDYLLQRSTALGKETKLTLQKAIPSEDFRNGLWLYADAHGDVAAIQDTLANLPPGTKSGVKRALEAALKLTPKELAWLPYVRDFYDIKAAEAQAAGIFEEGLADYFTHVWKVKDNMPEKLQAALNSGRVSEYFQFARERKLPTMLEGIRNPTMIPGKRLEPVLDPADIVPYYNYTLDRAIASREFMRKLSEMKASDGRPLLAPTGEGKIVQSTEFAVVNDRTGRAVANGIFKKEPDAQALSAQTPGTHVEPRESETLLIKSKVKPEELKGYDTVDHPSMRKWRWADTGPDGKTVLYEGQLLAHPEALQRLRRMMDRRWLTPTTGVSAALRYSGEVKAAKLGLLSLFHQIHVGKHAIFHGTNPFMRPPIDWESPATRYAIEKGHLKLAPNPSELNALSEGIMANDALIHKIIPFVGPWSRAYSEWLFTKYIPKLKMATFENALARAQKPWFQKTFGGGATPLVGDELAARIGDSVNAAFGELNQLWLGKNGRNPRFQRALRLAFLAPDFGEARLRFVGKAFTKYGAEERFALAMNAALVYGAARIANWMISGDPEANDLRHAFDVKVKVGGKDYWMSMRSVMTDIEHAMTDFSRFIRVRMNPAYSTPLIDFLSSTNWKGQRRTGMQWLKDRLGALVPISLQALTEDDRHMWQSFMASMGVAPRRGDAVSEIHERAKKWRDARGIKSPVDVHESPEGNPYREARLGLDFNDPRRFWRALQEQQQRLKASESANPTKAIEAAFKRYYNFPFSGKRSTEQQFIQSLPDRDKKIYTQALQQRAADWEKFQNWWQEHERFLGE